MANPPSSLHEQAEPHGIQVLTLIGTRIARITAFNDPSLVPMFAPVLTT
jgi:RNA polymerase sigma-70 factor (ECF subfamily)